MRRCYPILAALLVVATPVSAACPPQAVGTLPQAIRDNEARLLCLQREIAVDATRRKLEFDLRALDTQLRQIELQQKLNSIVVTLPPPVL
jgi:hypothetical protein